MQLVINTREEIYVPVHMSQLEANSIALVSQFAKDAHELLDRYLDAEYRKSLSFRKRKLLQIAVQLFVVPTTIGTARRIATKVNDFLWKIDSLDDYSSDTGLAHWQVDEHAGEEERSSTIVL